MKLFRVAMILIFGWALPSPGSVTSQVDRTGPFLITALPQVIPVGFPFQGGAELLVLDLGPVSSPIDPATALVRGSDYTTTGGGYNAANQMQTGSLTVVSTGTNRVAVNDRIIIMRNVPVNQTSSFVSTGPLTIQQLEQALDKQATLSQQLTEASSRSLRFEQGETLDGTLIKTARAGKLLGFDSSGNISYSTGGGGGGGTQYTAGTGLILNSNEFSVNPTQSITSLTVTNPIIGSLSGNAATATALQTPRTINGVTFAGTANITVPAAAGTLTGTALASNVVTSSLTSVALGTLGSIALQSANSVSVTGGTITGATVTGLPTPTNSSDAVTKSYADSISTGIVPRTAVLVATTANIALAGTLTIDGVATVAGNRVLVKNQTTTSQNGIYDVAAGAWSRSSDSNTAGKLLFGYYYFVSSGSTQTATSWFIQTPPTVLGSDPVLFSQFAASASYTAGTGLGLIGNQFSINSSQSGLTLTSSAFNGTVGATTPSTGSFTQTTTTGNSFLANLVAKGGQLNEAATNAVASVDINYDGYAGGTTQFRNHTIYDGKNNIVALFTGSTKSLNVVGGINTTTVGATTPASGAFTTLSGSVTSTGGSASRTLADRFATVYNVKDYGAAGNGVTNDTSAVAAASAAALSAHGALYFPAGTYLTDTLSVTSAAGMTIFGDGMGVSIIKARTPSQVLHVYTSSRVNVYRLTFDGSCTTRTAGQQAVVMDASSSSFCDNEIINSGEFAAYFGADSAITDVIVSRNYIHAVYADGINFGAVTKGIIANNIIDGSDDDCIAVGYNGSGASSLINVIGNYCRARTDLGTTWGRGILVLCSHDIQIIGNYVENIKQYGLIMDNDGGGRPTRVQVINNVFKDCAINSGHAVALFRTTDCQFEDNNIIDPYLAGADCLEIADWQNLTIQGGYYQQVRNQFCRGIHADEGGGWAASWDTIKVSRVSINMSGASTNSCVYLNPTAAVTMNTGVIDGVVGQQVVAGDYITVGSARSGTLWKIVNNTTASAGKTVSPASGGVFTTVNNN